MALIKCPRCGQTVLSVASTCPKCSYLLLQEPKEESAAGALVQCRRCSKLIPPESAACPYCAYPIRRVKVLTRAGIAAGVAAVGLITVLIMLGRGAGPESIMASAAGTPARTAVEPTTEPVDRADPDTALSAAAIAAPAQATPRPAAASPRQPAPRDTATAPVRRPPPTSPTEPAARNTRWSLDWVNVREGRGVDNAIVTVLRPGIRVQVADQRGGWWAVYVEGSFVGYASGALFGAEPPSDTTT